MLIAKSDRITLETASVIDAPFFLHLMNTASWLQFIGNRNINSVYDAEEYIASKVIRSYSDFGFGLWKVSLTENLTPIGICGLLKRPDFEHPDLGFALLPQFEKMGFGFEAANLSIEFAKKINIINLDAITLSSNVNSISLLSKLGFIFSKKIQMDDEVLETYTLKINYE